MQVKDEGYIIKILKYGENSLILTVLSQAHGKMTGFIKSGLTKKKLGVYQLGNKISFNAYARLEENMPQFRGVELLESNVVHFLTDSKKLAVLSAFCELFNISIPENEPLEGLVRFIYRFMDNLGDEMWLQNYAVLEFRLLYFLGIGLDLGACAVTGAIDNLAFVSPKSGRAVCLEAGLPYQEKLFKYPHFAFEKNVVPLKEDVLDLLKMNAFFLKKNFFDAHGLQFPISRANLEKILI
ncbi:MAG: DNA repair protein RecO [Alphaproteobacteria bacterium]|nr:DNA repair protein RecO [Alphaproteobacteria bacterium]